MTGYMTKTRVVNGVAVYAHGEVVDCPTPD